VIQFFTAVCRFTRSCRLSGSTYTVTSASGSQSLTDTISSIVIYGFGGDDTLRVTYSVSVPTTI
jgi:hypothetical protein